MARLARGVVADHPHHVTQRGNGRARTFFGDDDYALYRDLLAENCRGAGVEVWSWCLMRQTRAEAVGAGREELGALSP